MIGLNDQASDGEYGWTDGTPFDFAWWKDGAPNNNGEQDRGDMEVAVGGRWNDVA